MNVLIIPSWYPSEAAPSTGIFFKEQGIALAKYGAGVNVGISTWGQNDPSLLLEARHLPRWPQKLLDFKKASSRKVNISSNCVEYFQPALTWSRRWKSGNMRNIISSNRLNAKLFVDEFGDIDIIHAHVAHPAGYVAMQLSRDLGVPYVITEHMSPFPLPAYASAKEFERWILPSYRQSSSNIAVSTSLQRKMKEKGIDSVVIPNLVDGSIFQPGKEEVSSKEIVTIARLEPQKGIAYLLRAFHLLRQDWPDLTLKVIGHGTLAGPLQRLAQDLGIASSVRWLGEGTREEVIRSLQACSFVVLPSLHENLPLVLLEAIACGKPVVATRCEGPEDIVNDKNGLLALPGDVPDLYHQLRRMVGERNTYHQQGIRADFEARYSSVVVTKELVTLYSSVIGQHKK